MKVRLFFKGYHHSYNKTVLAFLGGQRVKNSLLLHTRKIKKVVSESTNYKNKLARLLYQFVTLSCK